MSGKTLIALLALFLLAFGAGYIHQQTRLLERDIDEVAVLIMDLARKNKIRRRKNGVLGEV